MWVASGKKTGKIYAKGKYKADVLRELQKKYPYKKNKYQINRLDPSAVYPEQLIIVKRKHLRLVKK